MVTSVKPYIFKAKNEPDVYETFNSNPNQVKTEAIEDDSPNVEKINISTKDAQEKFNKKILNTQFAGIYLKLETRNNNSRY